MSKTRLSTVNRAIAFTVVLTTLATVGFLWATAIFLLRADWWLAGIFLVALAGLLYRSYTASQDFRRQVARHTRGHPELARQYEHLWYICKRPHLCSRCRGWLAGVGLVFGAWITAVIFYNYSPEAIANWLGIPLAVVLGAVCLLATPIHGMLGRVDRLDPNSFWESEVFLSAIGFLNALAAPILASVVLRFVVH